MPGRNIRLDRRFCFEMHRMPKIHVKGDLSRPALGQAYRDLCAVLEGVD